MCEKCFQFSWGLFLNLSNGRNFRTIIEKKPREILFRVYILVQNDLVDQKDQIMLP